MPEHILISDPVEHVVTITLNNPGKKNALSTALRDEVSSALGELAAAPAVKVVIITGTGDTFSAGFNLKEFQLADANPGLKERLWASSDRFYHACLYFPLPLIAAINGPAIAGGFDLATACDLRIACSEAYFSHPEYVWSRVMYSPLQELVGGAVARELCLTGRRVDAQEALTLRLVSSVVSRHELADEAGRYAALIAKSSRENLLMMKAKIVRKAAIAALATLDL